MGGARGVHAQDETQAIDPGAITDLVPEQIAAGIKAHIAKVSDANGGVFPLSHDGGELKLKLVRVHMEYLSSLGEGRHFACVDLAGADGNVYDVDFFLKGTADALEVTETTVHKVNGRPLYLWEEQEDETWTRVGVDQASQELLGVVEGSDRFQFMYQFTLPTIESAAQLWLPLPQSDQFQTIGRVRVSAPHEARTLVDKQFGNKVLYFELGPDDSGEQMKLSFEVTRSEKSAYAPDTDSDAAAAVAFLAPESRVPADESFEQTAKIVTAGKDGNDLQKARALYDHTLERMRYMKYGEGWGQGDALRAQQACSGNCTDYHAYFIALARASGIPARFAIGAAVPSDRDDGGVDGYHCWAEFFADGKWWPVDISEADKYSALSTYYFGRNGANRVEFSRGRDLVVEPGPASGPINFLAYPVLEVAGKPVPVKTVFGFKRLEAEPPSPAQRADDPHDQ